MRDATRWCEVTLLVFAVALPLVSGEYAIALDAHVGWGDSVELTWNRTSLPASQFSMYRLSRTETQPFTLPPASSYPSLYNETDQNVTRYVDRTVTPPATYYYRIELVNRNGQVVTANAIQVTTWPGGVFPHAWTLGSAVIALGLAFILGWATPILFPQSKSAGYLGDQMFRLMVLSLGLFLVSLMAFALGF